MKKNAFATLIKDVILALAAWGIAAMLLSSGFGVEGAAVTSGAMVFAGVPFGWRWASNIISAVSLKGVGIKLLIALFLGWFAIFLVIGLDVIRYIGQLFGSLGAKKTRS